MRQTLQDAEVEGGAADAAAGKGQAEELRFNRFIYRIFTVRKRRQFKAVDLGFPPFPGNADFVKFLVENFFELFGSISKTPLLKLWIEIL